jgi:hypothetical protein
MPAKEGTRLEYLCQRKPTLTSNRSVVMAPVKWKWEPVAHANDQVMPVPTPELRRNVDLIEGKLSTVSDSITKISPPTIQLHMRCLGSSEVYPFLLLLFLRLHGPLLVLSAAFPLSTESPLCFDVATSSGNRKM